MSSPTVSEPPKYSLPEHERRWLVDPARLPALDGPGRLIEDRYIDGTRLRLRRVDGEAKLGKKYAGVGLSDHPIVNVYLDASEYAALATLPAAVLVKRRWRLGGFVIDRFEGRLAGLWLAEAEAPTRAALLDIVTPDWCAVEVTDDPRYTGGVLARADLPPTEGPVMARSATPPRR